ncbi:MAG TPA: Fur family transcriptional regulator [bacterium]|nr:Fur family transcriptional regulator [bacterium]
MPSPPSTRAADRQRFAEYLRTHGYKSTPERMTVMEEVLSAMAHFTVDDLYDQLRARGEKRVSRATIYRTLELLAESGLVNKLDWIAATTHYELAHADEHHDHFVCTYCGQIYEFYSPSLEEVQDRVCSALGLAVESHTLKMEGIPRFCRDHISYPGHEPPAERGRCPFGFQFNSAAAESV